MGSVVEIRTGLVPLKSRHRHQEDKNLRADGRRKGEDSAAGRARGAVVGGMALAVGAARWYSGAVPSLWEGTIMKLPRRKFLHLVAGAAAPAALPHIARAQTAISAQRRPCVRRRTATRFSLSL